MSESKELFTSFRPVSKVEWIKKIEADLKGQPYSSLIWHTPEGLSVEPIHHRDDRRKKAPLRFSTENQRWIRRQNFIINTGEEARQAMQALSESEFDAIGLNFRGHLTADFLPEILQKADQLQLAIHLHTKDVDIENGMLAFAAVHPQIAARLKGSIEEGESPSMRSIAFQKAFPAFYHFISSDSKTSFENDSLIEAIVHTLQAIDQVIQKALPEGQSIASIRDRLLVNVQIGSDYFREMARLRATRFLIANLFLQYDENLEKADQFTLHVRAAGQPGEDPYRNLLKNTTSALAALAGTADMLSLDSRGEEVQFARLNRNIQLILFYENKAGRVADPYFDSYYVEELSDQLAKAAWEQFIENEMH